MIQREQVLSQCRAERSGDVELALAPVEAAEHQRPPG
jgi:hypothetical protein